MINLLATDKKAEIRAARVNVILVQYTAILLLALVFIVGIFYYSLMALQNTMASANSLVEANDIKADVYSDTRQQVATLEANLTEAKSVLDQEVRYSKLLVGIGQLLPAGTIIDSLPLDTTALNGAPVQIKAYAKTNTEAVALQERLKSSPLFSSISVQATSESDGISGYPVSITMSVVFNKAGVQ